MDSRLAELYACVHCLGFTDDGEYKIDEDATGSLREIVAILRYENPTFDIRKTLGEVGIVPSDIIPMIKWYHEDEKLFDLCIRLLMSLTQPVLILFKQEIPQDKNALSIYLELEALLRNYKKAFADELLLKVLCQTITKLFEKDWEERYEADRLLIERILIVVRNILHIPPDYRNNKAVDSDGTIHDQLVWILHTTGWDDLLLFMSNADDERQSFAFHTLEIISLLYRDQAPEILASAGKSGKESLDPTLELLRRAKIREAENKRLGQLQMPIRGNRFCGTYELPKWRTVANHSAVYMHDPTKGEISLDKDKQGHRLPKNRQPKEEKEVFRHSSLKVQLHLQEFSLKFLEYCYNPLMRTAKGCLMRHNSQPGDETYYLWCLHFFMTFYRLHCNGKQYQADFVSETMNVETFHWVYEQLMNYQEQMQLDKKHIVQWSRRLQLGLNAFNCLFHSLRIMSDKGMPQSVQNAASNIKANIFYQIDYREVYPLMLRQYNPVHQSQIFLKNLVEGTHVLIRMLEEETRHGVMLVKEKTRAKPKKGRKKTKIPEVPMNEELEIMTEEEKESIWYQIVDDLTKGIEGALPLPSEEDLPRLFDPLESLEEEEQVNRAISSIQQALHSKEMLKALALLRVARTLWPQSPHLEMEDEFLLLRTFHMMRLNKINSDPKQDAPNEADDLNDCVDGDDEMEILDEEFDFHECPTSYKEVTFDIKSYVLRFAHADIIRSYLLLLQHYNCNSKFTNHCLTRMLHRLAVDQKLPTIVFQLRLFRIFQKFARDPLQQTPEFQELQTFMLYMLRKFFHYAQKDERVFVEILFYRSMREATDIEQGYDNDQAKSKNEKWSKAEDAELAHLYEEAKNMELPPSMDLGDFIVAKFSDDGKTRRQIIHRMSHLNIISNARELKKHSGAPKSKTRREWSEEEEMQLHSLYEQFQQSNDPLEDIMKEMLTPRSKKAVVKKLVELNIVQDKSQLRKKRTKSGKAPHKERRQRSDGDEKKKSKMKASENHQQPGNFVSEEFVVSSESSSSSDDNEMEMEQLHRSLMEEILADKGEENMPMSSSSDSDAAAALPSNDESDEEESRANKKKALLNFLKEKKSQPKRKKTQEKCDPAKIQRELSECNQQTLPWLLEQLRIVVEERESGIKAPIPIVAVTEEEKCLVDSCSTLMAALGFHAPNSKSSQSFWTISDTMADDSLHSTIDIIQSHIDKPSTVQLQIPEIPSSTASIILQEGKSSAKKRHLRMSSSEESSDDNSGQDKENNLQFSLSVESLNLGSPKVIKASSAKKRKLNVVESDDDL